MGRAPGADAWTVRTSGLSLRSTGLITRLHRRQDAIGLSLERLATGKRINRASDDPAGAIAVNEMTARIKSIERRITGLERESIWLGARDGAFSALGDLLAGLNGTVVSAANRGAVGEEERAALADEAGYAIDAIAHLTQVSQFQGDRLLDFDIANIASVGVTRIDADGNEVEERKTLRDLRELLTGDREDLEAAQSLVDQATRYVGGARGSIGNRITNTIEPEIRVLQSELENLTGARSQIEDTDFAQETADLIRNQILEQAAIFTIQIAQQSAESVLGLLDNVERG